jgi:UDP-glucose 4-epimerase
MKDVFYLSIHKENSIYVERDYKMKVLVTGGAGYIGSHTVRELIERGYDVVILDTLEMGNKRAIGDVKLYQANITDGAMLEYIFTQEKPEAVIHFAANKAPGESMTEPGKFFHNNVDGTLSLLETMVHHNVPYIVFSSSCSIFGTPTTLPIAENAPFHPESVYGESKLMCETLLKWYDRTKNIRYCALRYFNASGASLDNTIGEDWDHTQNLIPLMMKAAVGLSPSMTLFGTDYSTPDGTAIRDYVHVADLAVAHVKSLEYIVRTNGSTAYNLGSGKANSVQEVIDATKRISGRDFKVEHGPRRPGDPSAVYADRRKAERELGWKPRYDLNTILETAWKWHSTHPNGYQN